MMDKNLILAVVLSIGVYVAWFALVEPRVAPRPDSPPERARNVVAPPSTTPPDPSSPLDAAAGATAAASSRKPLPQISISIADAEIAVSPYGGAISSYRYRGPLGPVELILSTSTGMLSTWPGLAFAAIDRQRDRVTLQAAGPDGLQMRKEYVFSQNGGLHRLSLSVSNRGPRPASVPAWSLDLGPGLGTVASEQDENAKLWRAIALVPPAAGRKVDRLEHLKPGERQDSWRWAAVDNRYFIAAAVAPQGPSTSLQMEKGAPAPMVRIEPAARTLAPGESAAYELPFYIGPKGYLRLESLGLQLERAVDFGWFDSIGRFILKVLHFFVHRVGNYGWAIILLTVLVQAALSPLTYKGAKAAASMKRIQPEVARLQQKFASEPQRLNAEMMALYKTRGVNPLGGCLPILAQMPVFVALYNALRSSWELHGAPWMLWIRDLSAKDPYYVLPIVMGGVMLLQNKMNPAMTADPAQKKMMTWMPVIFTFMFVNFPAGLVLYWLTNSILSVVQQSVWNRRFS